MTKLYTFIATCFILTLSTSKLVAESSQCSQCHAAAVQAWSKSHHAKAMAVATSENVLGDFNNTEFEHHDLKLQFVQQDSQFKVMLEEEGSKSEYIVEYTFGVEPLQQYLVATGQGRYQVLPAAWDARPKSEGGQRWYMVIPEVTSTDDRFHWLQPLQNWNGMCADCHSAGLKRGFAPDKNTFNTTWRDINVSCNACHVIDDKHAEGLEPKQYYGKSKNRGYWRLENDSDVAQRFEQEPDNQFMQQCFACHSLRSPLTDGFNSTQNFLDQFSPQLLNPNLYHADGQINEEVYVYGSFLQSKMFKAGVNCLDCHDPHSMELKTEGNGLCLQCHNSLTYQVDKHLHQPPGSSGSECVDCHMPHQTYMGIDDRRDHSFIIPRPELAKYDVPNACTQCHAEKTNQWAEEQVAKLYRGVSELTKSEHVFIKLMASQTISLPDHLALINDDSLSVIKRASAILLLPQSTNLLDSISAKTLASSKHDLIRLAVAEVGFLLNSYDREELLTPLLDDSLRAVRVAAAEQLLSANLKSESFQAALNELLLANEVDRWRGEGALNQSLVYMQQGKRNETIATLQQGISVDPYFVGNYINLTDYYRSLNLVKEELKTLNQGIAKLPESAILNYSYGLYLIRQRDRENALSKFAKAVEHGPTDSRYAIAYLLTLDALGQTEKAYNWLKDNLTRYAYDANLEQVAKSIITKYRQSGFQ